MPKRPRAFRILVVALAGLITSCGGAEVGTVQSSQRLADPHSTLDVAVFGGASLGEISSEQLAAMADTLVMVNVLDVYPSIANTADGRFPSLEEMEATAEASLHPLSGLVLYTPVRVQIVEVLAEGPVNLPIGSESTVLVPGGAISTMLGVDAAALLGVTVVETGIDGAGMSVERLVAPTHPVEFTWGHAPSELLSEGETLILALGIHSPGRFGGGQLPAAFTTIDPAGVFREADGAWVPDRPLVTRMGSSTSPYDLARLMVERDSRTP